MAFAKDKDRGGVGATGFMTPGQGRADVEPPPSPAPRRRTYRLPASSLRDLVDACATETRSVADLGVVHAGVERCPHSGLQLGVDLSDPFDQPGPLVTERSDPAQDLLSAHETSV